MRSTFSNSSETLGNGYAENHAVPQVSQNQYVGPRRSLEVTSLQNVVAQPVDWLWPGRFPLGMLSLLVGDPGLGKSMLTLDMAARISRGLPWPDNSNVAQLAGRTILFGSEDPYEAVVKPRLEAIGADPSMIDLVSGTQLTGGPGVSNTFNLQRDADLLRSLIEAKPDTRLVVMDPLNTFIGGTNSYKDDEVRQVLAPLCSIARDFRIAVIGVMHLRKSEGRAIQRAMGSMAFTAVARAVWTVAQDGDNPNRRNFLPVKFNLGYSAKGLAFNIEDCKGAGKIVWSNDPVSVTADEALAVDTRERGRPPTRLRDAQGFLRLALANGPREMNEVLCEGDIAGHSETTLIRAKKEMNIGYSRDSCRGPSYWHLPEHSPMFHRMNNETPNNTNCDNSPLPW